MHDIFLSFTAAIANRRCAKSVFQGGGLLVCSELQAIHTEGRDAVLAHIATCL